MTNMTANNEAAAQLLALVERLRENARLTRDDVFQGDPDLLDEAADALIVRDTALGLQLDRPTPPPMRIIKDGGWVTKTSTQAQIRNELRCEPAPDDRAANKAGGLWYRRWHAAELRANAATDALLIVRRELPLLGALFDGWHQSSPEDWTAWDRERREIITQAMMQIDAVLYPNLTGHGE